MCGIAGMMDLAGQRTVPEGVVRRMAQALFHRGPDEDGYLMRPGLALASRRLSIVGLADGRQPIANEDGSVIVVFNGELFDYVERRAELQGRGHRFHTHCDTEIIPHLWEEHQEGMFERLRGQFAIALWDVGRRQLTLARDRFGISPLYWTRQGDWLLFASEIKALLASGMVPARPDRCGIDEFFTFTALPGPTTCFEGVSILPPGRYLQVSPRNDDSGESIISERAYWQMDFPDRGQEDPGDDPKRLVDGFEQVLLQAVEKRLRADVPVGAYLSGGLDSSVIVALAAHLRKGELSSYTVRIDDPKLDELSQAKLVAQHVGIKPPVVQEFGTHDALKTFPSLIQAAEAPVMDTACAALLQLAQRVHACGQKVVLTGEGADEWLVGYPWYKMARALGFLNLVPGLRLGDHLPRAYLRLHRVPQYPVANRHRTEEAVGGPNAWIDFYGLIRLSKLRFFSAEMREVMEQHHPWAELDMDLERARRWHPLNRGVWIAGRTFLAGHLLASKGDRVAMHSSVEVRYPFLDEDVFAFLAKLHPRWKLRGFRDKHILRLVAERWVPPSIARRRKAMFMAPLDSFHARPEPEFVGQLLSEESLRRTGYFDVAAVRHWRDAFRLMRPGSLPRISVEMGLAAVVTTQLWHHLFIDGTLADLPRWTDLATPMIEHHA